MAGGDVVVQIIKDIKEESRAPELEAELEIARKDVKEKEDRISELESNIEEVRYWVELQTDPIHDLLGEIKENDDKHISFHTLKNHINKISEDRNLSYSGARDWNVMKVLSGLLEKVDPDTDVEYITRTEYVDRLPAGFKEDIKSIVETLSKYL